MLNKEELTSSMEFRDSIATDEVVLIHSPYEFETPSFVVIHKKDGFYSITRFWRSPNRKDQLEKIHHKRDYGSITAEEVFVILLEQYSKKLDSK